MAIPGIDSILYKSAIFGWPTEPSPPQALVDLFAAAKSAIESEQYDIAKDYLEQITYFRLQPSQQMRLQYLKGRLLHETGNYSEAFQRYDIALRIAENNTGYDDFYSRIVLNYSAGLMLYGSLRNQEAIEYYEEAFDIWRAHARVLAHPPIEPVVTIFDSLGKSQWNIGKFEQAQGTISRVLALAQIQRTKFSSNYLMPMLASVLWTHALILRSQSDISDGDANLIRTALKRAKKSLGLYATIGTTVENLGRFSIQIAELYLDLAELHFLRGARRSAQQMRKEGYNYARLAVEYIEPTLNVAKPPDYAAMRLAELAQLRHFLTGRSQSELAQTLSETESRLDAIEHAAIKGKDGFIFAKAMTLRGEWLLALGDKDAARNALLLALKGFYNDGIGMATRAERLFRRIEAMSAPLGGQEYNSSPPTSALNVFPDEDNSQN